MIQNAIVIALLYWVINVVDTSFLSWQCLTRPIVVAPLTGLLLGDFRTGIIMGASLESIFMGISAIGGSIPADATTSSIIAVAFTILTGTDIEAGLAIAMPIGALMSSFSSLFMTLWSSLAPYWENLAVTDINKFTKQVIAFATFISPLPGVIVLFTSVAYGIDGLSSILAALPAWATTGLGAASGMMIAVGYAILTSMIWSNELGCFFFVGYVLVRYAGLDTLAIAIIGAAIAITMFFSEKRNIALKTSGVVSATANDPTDEEDFF